MVERLSRPDASADAFAREIDPIARQINSIAVRHSLRSSSTQRCGPRKCRDGKSNTGASRPGPGRREVRKAEGGQGQAQQREGRPRPFRRREGRRGLFLGDETHGFRTGRGAIRSGVSNDGAADERADGEGDDDSADEDADNETTDENADGATDEQTHAKVGIVSKRSLSNATSHAYAHGGAGSELRRARDVSVGLGRNHQCPDATSDAASDAASDPASNPRFRRHSSAERLHGGHAFANFHGRE